MNVKPVNTLYAVVINKLYGFNGPMFSLLVGNRLCKRSSKHSAPSINCAIFIKWYAKQPIRLKSW